jgi:hypothetical protein
MDEAKAKKMYKTSLILRGVILDATVHMERIIDNYLSDYFCVNELRGNELKEMLWNTERITLSAKKDLLFMLINRYHKVFLETYPKFIDTLDKLIPHRNIFAHLELDFSSDNLENSQFSFKKYHNGKLTNKVYTKEAIDKITADFKHVIEALDTLKPVKPPTV